MNIQIFRSYIREAEDRKVKIAIENCPMLFGRDQWPGGQNLMTTPAIWEKVFDILQSDYLGINYEPSHFVWRMIDYIEPIYTFADKIFHVHYKDIKLYPEKLNRVRTMAYPLEYMSPKILALCAENLSYFFDYFGLQYDKTEYNERKEDYR